MSQQRQNRMMMMNPTHNVKQVGDTTYTKIFVGGLAWETKRDSLKRYFEQFGEISEAVVITDRNTGASKGYGFVTFKDPDSAMRACQNPYPLIDARRANCNLAALGARKFNSSSPTGAEKFNTSSWAMVPAAPFQGSSSYYNQHLPHYTFPFPPPYRYPGYPPSQELYAMNYYNVYGGNHLPFRWRPAIYQPSFYGMSNSMRLPAEAMGKKTQYSDTPAPQEMLAVVGVPPEPISVSASIPTSGLVAETVSAAAAGKIGASTDHKSSA